MKKEFLVVCGAACMVGVIASTGPAGASPTLLGSSESISLIDANQCWQSCMACQKPCDDKPAGSARDNCKEACTSNAAGCCSSAGRKPPNYLSCTCGM